MAKHGIFIQEEATALTVPVECSASIPVAIGIAPVNMAEDPSAVVNVPILANSASEAMAALGYSEAADFSAYTLCQVMYTTGNLFAVAPAVYINVLDPSKHKEALAETSVEVSQMQATIEKFGVLKDGLTVKSGATALALDTDYTLEFDSATGYLVISLIAGGAGASATSLTVSGNVLKPSLVTASDIIGAYDAATGKETGLQLIRQVYPKLGVVPGLIIAPGFSQDPAVGSAMAAKAANINGIFKAMAILDLDTTKAKKYTDCKTVKEESGFTSAYCAVVWPCDKVGDKIFAKSAVMAALTAYQDANNDDVPSASPSNKMLGVSGQCGGRNRDQP